MSELPQDARRAEFGDDWEAIWSVRNRISHGYIFLDRRIIEETLRNDVAPFLASLDRLEARLDRTQRDRKD